MSSDNSKQTTAENKQLKDTNQKLEKKVNELHAKLDSIESPPPPYESNVKYVRSDK